MMGRKYEQNSKFKQESSSVSRRLDSTKTAQFVDNRAPSEGMMTLSMLSHRGSSVVQRFGKKKKNTNKEEEGVEMKEISSSRVSESDTEDRGRLPHPVVAGAGGASARESVSAKNSALIAEIRSIAAERYRKSGGRANPSGPIRATTPAVRPQYEQGVFRRPGYTVHAPSGRQYQRSDGDSVRVGHEEALVPGRLVRRQGYSVMAPLKREEGSSKERLPQVTLPPHIHRLRPQGESSEASQGGGAGGGGVNSRSGEVTTIVLQSPEAGSSHEPSQTESRQEEEQGYQWPSEGRVLGNRQDSDAGEVGPNDHPLAPGWQGGQHQTEESQSNEHEDSGTDDQAMEGYRAKQQTNRETELRQLGGGRRDRRYMGQGNQADLRSLVLDPRFEYSLHRGSDHGNRVSRLVKSAKEKGKEALHKAGVTVGAAERRPGENFDQEYDRRNEVTGEKAKRYAEIAVDQATNYIPLVSTAKQGVKTKNEHDKMNAAKEVAEDGTLGEVPHALAEGLVEQHRMARNQAAINTAAGVVSDVTSVATAGASGAVASVAKNVVSAGTKAAKYGNQAYNAVTSNDRETRMEAVEDMDASPKKEQVDTSNEALVRLMRDDPEFAQAVMTHLRLPVPDVRRELALHRDIQRPDGDHTLRPSEVSKNARYERGRQNLRNDLGRHMQTLDESEGRGLVDTMRNTAASIRDRLTGNRTGEEDQGMELQHMPTAVNEGSVSEKGEAEPEDGGAPPAHLPAVHAGGVELVDFLNELDPGWAIAAAVAGGAGVGNQAGPNEGVMAGAAAEHQDVLPVQGPMDLPAGLSPMQNSGSGALCYIFGVIMGLTGARETPALRELVYYIARVANVQGGWIAVDADAAHRVNAVIEQLFGVRIQVVEIQNGVDGPIIAGRSHNESAGKILIVLRNNGAHYETIR